MSKSNVSSTKTKEYFNRYMEGVEKRNSGESEFVQAVYEVASTIFPYIADKPIYHEMQILERMAEPERVISFSVPWSDDDGNIRTNRGWRVQFNSAIGPYKGGLRFHPSVNQSILKFLGFEQTFKNSLTGLPMGGGKGGSNFNPKGKSELEVMRFCQSFMTELYRHIGADTDVPAGDIGVGGREIGFMFGQYKRITNHFVGILTGKGLSFGGSKMRTEATGYGAIFFVQNMLQQIKEDVEGKTVLISGSGNVATHAAEKVLQLGGKPLTLSDSGGFIECSDGLTQEQIDWIKDRYDITIDTKSLSIFGFPIPDYSDNQKLNIIGKEAINILVGVNIIKNKWSFSASFSQHIPYKIDVIETIVSEEEKKEDIYGGGEFNLSIIRYLDQ